MLADVLYQSCLFLAYTSKTSFSEDSRLTGYCLALESIGVFEPGGKAE